MSSSAPFLIPDIQHHSLQSTWTFSYCFPPRSPDIKIDQWERYLHYFTDFSSFEDFYGIINSIEKPSQLPVGCRYYVFRKGIIILIVFKIMNILFNKRIIKMHQICRRKSISI